MNKQEHVAVLQAMLRDSTIHPSVHAALTAAIAAMQRQGEPVAWMLDLANEIEANAEDHPAETMSRFAFGWADTLAAHAIAALPPQPPTEEQARPAQQAVTNDVVDRFWAAYINDGKGGGAINYRDVGQLLTAALAQPPAEGAK